MIPTDAGVVITTMQAMWPAHTWREGEAARLVEHLLGHEFQDVMACLAVLERTTRFWPHWSEMADVLGGIMRRRREALEVEKADTGEAVAPPERARGYIAECRRIVAGWNPKTAPLARALSRFSEEAP